MASMRAAVSSGSASRVRLPSRRSTEKPCTVEKMMRYQWMASVSSNPNDASTRSRGRVTAAMATPISGSSPGGRRVAS